MKKIYLQPEVICCVLQSKMMMAVSGPLSEEYADVDGSGNLNNEVKGYISDKNVWENEW